MEKEIRRQRSAKDMILSLVFVLGGSALFFIPSVSWGILGVLLIAVGILLFFTLKSLFRIEGSEAVFSRKTIDLPASRKDALIKFLSGETDNVDMTPSQSGNSLLLYVYTSKNEAYASISEYSSYEYKPCFALKQITLSQASKLAKG